MGAVSNFLDFKARDKAPTLVLVDLHHAHSSETGANPRVNDLATALEQCRAALGHARRHGLPVAFVRHMSPPQSFLANPAYPSWLGDIRPRRSDMIFERPFPSCYASSEFAQMALRSRELVLAGLFGETSCLTTLMEGYGRGHAFTYLADASVSRGVDSIPPDQVHRSVTAIASLYSGVSSTEAWMNRTSRTARTVGYVCSL
jgi:nicotinamidase-related amidase